MRRTSLGVYSRSKTRLAETSLSITIRSCGAVLSPAGSKLLSQYPQLVTALIRRRRSAAAVPSACNCVADASVGVGGPPAHGNATEVAATAPAKTTTADKAKRT